MRHLTLLAALCSLQLALPGCAQLGAGRVLEQQRPQVSIAAARLTRLDFERLNLAFDMAVENPNPVGIELAGLDYELKLAGERFASGRQTKRMRIDASGQSRFVLPLSLSLPEIIEGVKQAEGRNSIPYELSSGLVIEVPLLGKLRYPVTTSGELPIPRLPSVTLQRLEMERLSYSGATMLLTLAIENPNAFGLDLQQLDYDFRVNGKRWASGSRAQLGQLQQQGKSLVTLPLSLDFMELGSSLYGLLSRGEDLHYTLGGKLDASSDHKLIGDFTMPLAGDGTVRLAR